MNILLKQLINENECCLRDFECNVVLKLKNIYENYENDYKSLNDLKTQIKDDLFISINDNNFVLSSSLCYLLSQMD